MYVEDAAPVYVEDAVAECLEDGMEEAEREFQLQQLHHQVDADECVSSGLLHIRQPVTQSAPLRHPYQKLRSRLIFFKAGLWIRKYFFRNYESGSGRQINYELGSYMKRH